LKQQDVLDGSSGRTDKIATYPPFPQTVVECGWTSVRLVERQIKGALSYSPVISFRLKVLQLTAWKEPDRALSEFRERGP